MTLNLTLAEESATDLEKAEAIRDVMQHAATMTQAVLLAREMKSWPVRPISLAVIAILSLSLCIYTFVGQPDWAFGPDPAEVAPVRRDAHLKFAMVMAAQRLEALRDSSGVPPASLVAANEEWPGLAYEVGDSVFVLRAVGASGDPITFRSNEDPKAFLSDSRRHLRDRRGAP